MTAADPEDAARAALRARQGTGARYDAASAPAEDLLLARRGTAYFARVLNGLADAALDAPSLRRGCSRRRLVAHVGYHARALAWLVESARTGVAQPMYASAAARDAEVASGATLPARALRSLVQHAAIHLDVEWRDLSEAAWDAEVGTLDGARIPVRDTPLLRAREVWRAAIQLAAGGRDEDIPEALRARIAERS